MKVTFLVPPPLDGKLAAERVFGCNYGIYCQPNIFMLYPATVLKHSGHKVKVLDCPVEEMGKSDLMNFLRKDDSELYIFYTVFLSKRTDLLARDLIRGLRKNVKFVYMATEPTGCPQDFVASDSIVVRGEPEETMKELVQVLQKGNGLEEVKGVSYWKEGKIIDNPPRELISDLDSIPFPDRSLLEIQKYHNPKLSRLPFTAMIASRGCAYKCYYCVPNSLDFAREIEFKVNVKQGVKPPVRLRSAKNILQEIRMLCNEGYKSLSFLDDHFLWNNERILEICEEIKGLGLEWSCLARSDFLLEEKVIKAMAEAGCRYIDIGIESFRQEILDYISKDLKVETVYRACELLKKYSIEPELNILLGSCPLETKETFQYTISETKKLDVDYVLFSICTPFPHTEFNKIAKREGWMIKDEYEAIDPIKESFISYPHFPKKELEKMLRKAYLSFYFRPRYIFKRLKNLTGLRDFINKTKAAMTILRK